MNKIEQAVSDIFDQPLIFLAGPTGIGKTELALELAANCQCEIIGVDSMQIYKYMDIGTAKPSPKEMASIPHHLIDFVMPDQDYNANCFLKDCLEAIKKIRKKGSLPLLVGGTGLYFKALESGIFTMPDVDQGLRVKLQEDYKVLGSRALYNQLENVDYESAKRIHPNDSHRIVRALEIFHSTGTPWSTLLNEHKTISNKSKKQREKNIIKIGLERDRQELYSRINTRIEVMIKHGLLPEVNSLNSRGYDRNLKPMKSLGYRHMNKFIDGECTWEQSVDLLARDTRRYAKRQFTWFKSDKYIKWFHPDQTRQIFDLVKNHICSTHR